MVSVCAVCGDTATDRLTVLECCMNESKNPEICSYFSRFIIPKSIVFFFLIGFGQMTKDILTFYSTT